MGARDSMYHYQSKSLARTKTGLVSQETDYSEYLENQMIDQFDYPMKFYTKSKTVLVNINAACQDPLTRSKTGLVKQDTPSDLMVDKFDDPMKFYTKSRTVLINVVNAECILSRTNSPTEI